MSTLNADAVSKIVTDCLFTAEELKARPQLPPDNHVRAEGITTVFAFHPERLEKHREEVKAMLAELPEPFHEGKGDGWSFLNACVTKDGEQWGEHSTMEQLFCLGIGLKLARWCMPRPMWTMFPGGMPYVVVNVEGLKGPDEVRSK